MHLILCKILTSAVFPSECIYLLFKDHLSQKEVDKNLTWELSSLVEKFSELNISSINYQKILSFKELWIIKEIIKASKFKVSLRKINLRIAGIDDTLKILCLLSEWKNLESVDLRYKIVDWFDYIDNPIDFIKSAEAEFHEKVGRAWRLKITTNSKLSQ